MMSVKDLGRSKGLLGKRGNLKEKREEKRD